MEEEEKHPAKRLKVDTASRNDFSSHSSNSTDTVVQCEKPVAVLAEKYTRRVETVSVYVADLRNPKLASKCIRELRESYPLEDLQHLKRVRRTCCDKNGKALQVLITKIPNNDVDQQKCERVLHGLELGQPFVVHVPKHQPLTRQQFNEASRLWPTAFHEDKYIAKMISGELFSNDDVKCINKNMSLAIEAANKGKNEGMVPIGAVVVDPEKGNVIAIAHDLRSHGNPLQHAIMVVIDLVAQDQSGGSWGLGYQQDNGIWVLRDSTDQVSGSMVLRDTAQTARNILDQEKTIKQSDKNVPYLCTGYDLYVTREPCVMCAMALVHSRIRRVYYGSKDTYIGALGSKYCLHIQDGLNHHFEAFSGVLQKQCDQLMTFSG